jgi:prepilin-type N-terminal cleavage/methylation domain-containing protein
MPQSARSVGCNRHNLFMAPKGHRIFGMTVMELLCVIAIISILAAVYLGAVAKAFVHVKKFLDFLGK